MAAARRIARVAHKALLFKSILSGISFLTLQTADSYSLTLPSVKSRSDWRSRPAPASAGEPGSSPWAPQRGPRRIVVAMRPVDSVLRFLSIPIAKTAVGTRRAERLVNH